MAGLFERRYRCVVFLTLSQQCISKSCTKLRSLSIEDCGQGIDADTARILVSMASPFFKYLTLFPRYAGGVSVFLPSSDRSYVSAAAARVLRDNMPSRVTVFTRLDAAAEESVAGLSDESIIATINDRLKSVAIGSAPSSSSTLCNDLVSPSSVALEHMPSCPPLFRSAGAPLNGFGLYVGSDLPADRIYAPLVSIGHVAAFRMYDDTQLLPLSYFSDV